MVRLVMKADGVSEAHLRHLYSGREIAGPDLNVPAASAPTQKARDDASIRAAENEGMPTRPGSQIPVHLHHAVGQT